MTALSGTANQKRSLKFQLLSGQKGRLYLGLFRWIKDATPRFLERILPFSVDVWLGMCGFLKAF
jgi:hypothetical protein